MAHDPVTITSLSLEAPPFTRQGDGAIVVIAGGADAGITYSIADRPVVIGTGDDCDITLHDRSVSRRHLEIARVGAGLQARDLGSKNGSFLAGERFEAAALDLGRPLRIGQTAIKVVPAEESVTPIARDRTAFGGLVGGSRAMQQLYAVIEDVAASSSAVIIEGETGVGKELVAEEIHRRSARHDQPFVVFDCGSVPENLVESILFGHVRGAFTGADSHRDGVFADANGGTVFLDEIGELKRDLQPALLRVLDRGMVRPVGETAYRNVDVRVVAATHRNLCAAIRDGRFREDLYYRLAVARLVVPPLRERPADLAPLIRHFLHRLGRPDLLPGGDALEALARHHWPGNVRELRNIVERAVVASRRRGGLDLASALNEGGRPRAGKNGHPPIRPFREAKEDAIQDFERDYLEHLMAQFGSMRSAADAASMDRKHLRTLLVRHGLLQKQGT